MTERQPLKVPLTPGAYLKHRRTAAGLSVHDVAARLGTEPRLAQHVRVDWLRLIEADAHDANFATIVALRTIYDFDLGVLERLALIQSGSDLPEPELCRFCARINDPFGSGWQHDVWWPEADLCSSCADPEQFPAIDRGLRLRELLDFSLPAHPDAAA